MGDFNPVGIGLTQIDNLSGEVDFPYQEGRLITLVVIGLVVLGSVGVT